MEDSPRTLLRGRVRLALAVTLACLAAAMGAAFTAGADAPARADAPAKPQADHRATPATAHDHTRNLSVPGTSERELRALETAALGPAHAAEHAAMRRAQSAQEPEQTVEPAQPVAKIAAVGDEQDPAQVGRWDPTASVTFPIVAIHAVMLPTGKVMIFSFPQSPRQNSAQAWIWDPVTGQKLRKDPPDWLDPKDGQIKAANIWCSGHTFTADGELVVFGGNLEFETATTTWKGLNKVYTFNPFAPNGGSWQEQPDMRHGRWYPTGVRMADGRIPITSGLDETGIETDPLNTHMNEEVELFTPPAARGGLGTLRLIGSTSYTDSALPPTGETYPHMFAMPSGRAMVVGPDRTQTWFLNTPGSTPWWTNAPDMSQRRLWGTAVPLPAGPEGSSKIMAVGGTSYSLDPSTNSTETFDEANAGRGWRAAPSLNIGRGHANTVLLPDGSMVEVGGGIGRDNSFTESPQHAANPEQKQVELWDPQTGEWRLGPAQQENRAYHSTALLLPDGRVLSAGDEIHGGKASDLGEIYEPPYLHKGVPRPTITSAPPSIKLGTGFGVQTPDTDITRATLVAPGSATHAVDMNQRVIELDVTRRTGCVDLEAPPNARVAPPGYYMLFLLNGEGVPSVAKFVKLHADGTTPAQCDTPEQPPDTTPPTVALVNPGAQVAGKVTLRANASDDIGVTSVRFKVGDDPIPDDDPTDDEVEWDTTQLANGGPYVLTAVASDEAGNSKTSAPVSVTIRNADRTPPSVTLAQPADGSTVQGTIRVIADAGDDEELAEVQFELDGQSLATADATGKTASVGVDWVTRNGSNGAHTLTAVAVDANDNRSQPAEVTVTVDNPPPPEEPPPNETPATKPPPPKIAPPVVTPPAPPRPNAAPVLTRLKLAGTKLSFRLSEAATVKVSFERRRTGRPRAAARYARLRTKLTLRGKAGPNSFTFNARRRGFKVGRYRLTAVATDSAGKRSASVRLGFKVIARGRARVRTRPAALIDSALARLGAFGTLF